MRATLFVDVFDFNYDEEFEGTCDECAKWANEKVVEAVDYMPRRHTLIRANTVVPNSHPWDFVIYSPMFANMLSIRFEVE